MPATSSCRAGCGALAIAKFGQHNRAIHAKPQLVRAIVPHPGRRRVAAEPKLQLILKPELISHRFAAPPFSPGRQTLLKHNSHTYHDKKSRLRLRDAGRGAQKKLTSAASALAAAAGKAKRRLTGASASGRAKSQERSVPAPASARVWAAPARRVPAAARRRTAVVALAPHPRHYAIASCRPGSPLVASARARASRRLLQHKVLMAGSRRRRC